MNTVNRKLNDIRYLAFVWRAERFRNLGFYFFDISYALKLVDVAILRKARKYLEKPGSDSAIWHSAGSTYARKRKPGIAALARE